MVAVELLKNMVVDTPIPILINNDTDIFLLNSHFYGYHMCMGVWNAIINDSVLCKNEEGNEFNTTVVVLFPDDCLKQNVVGHVPIYLSRTFYFCLKLPGCNIYATVTSKRVNRGADDGLEITVEYRFFGDRKAMTWVKIQIKKIENNVKNKVNRCMK